jgi:catechol 2,3-dioxygenase-like lactoylglutathione lyase family enzyme
MSFRVIALDHVNITTPDELEEEMVAWYSEVLGLQTVDKPAGTRRGRGAWFVVGDAQVHVSVDPHNPPKTAHFGLAVNDFDAAIGRLRDSGCHTEQADVIPGRQRCFVRDPAGNRVEILAYDAAEET